MRREGHSINDIYKRIGAAKSSVSIWVRDVKLSAHARTKIEARWTKGQVIAHATRRAATREKLNVIYDRSLNIVNSAPTTKELVQIYCAILYWCEGEKSKNDSKLNFVNSDPTVISSFLALFRGGFDIHESKLRACVHLHDYHDEEAQLQFWSKITTIPKAQFIKSYRKKNTGKQIREGYQGCVSIRYHDVEIARRVQGIARAFLQKFGSIS